MPAPSRLRVVLLVAAALLSSGAVALPANASATGGDALTWEREVPGTSGITTAPTVQQTATSLTVSGEATPPGGSYAGGFEVRFSHAAGELPVGTSTWGAGDVTAAVRADTRYLQCFDQAGRVQVHEALVDADGSVISFAASFVLTCPDGSSAGGEVRWRSALPYAAAESSSWQLDAGKREVGTASRHVVGVRNRGTTVLRVGTPVPTGDSAASWSVASTTCGTLAPGATCEVVLTARPDTRGPRGGVLHVPASTPGGGVRVLLGLIGIVKPYAPATVTVAAGVGRAQVRWSEVGVPDTTIDGYTVYRSTAGGPRTRIAGVQGLRYDDLTVQQGQSYVYSVDATNQLGAGPATTAAAVRIPDRELVWGGASSTWRRGAPFAPDARDSADLSWTRSVGTPAFSPDGRQMAYWADVPGSPGLYVASPDGRGARRVAEYYPLAYGLSWSTDGRTLLYLREASAGRPTTLVALPASGGTERVVTSAPDLAAVSAYDDRTALVSLQTGTERSLVRLDLATGARTPLRGSDGAFGRAALSPDGRTIAFTAVEGLTTDGMQLAATSVRLLPAPGGTPRTVPTSLELPFVLQWTGSGRSLLVQFRGTNDFGIDQRAAELPVDGSPHLDWGPTPMGGYGGPSLRYADVTAPVVTTTGAARTALAPTVTTTWRGSDLSGVVSYDVRTRRARYDGDYGPTTALPGLQATATTRTTTAFTAGYDTCVDVRARDGAGRTSAWTARCTARPLDDRSLVASRGWTRSASSGSYAGTVSTARSAGATLSLGKVVLTRGHLVATRCPGCGSVEVRVAGRLLGTVSLAAPVTQRQVLVPLPGAGTTRVGPLVLRTTSARPVHVDGVAVGRS